MELYLPSLIILLLAGLVIIAILPRLSPLILVIIVSLLLAITGYHHATLFREEYAQSTWQKTVYNSGYAFVIAMVVLLSIGFALNFIRSRVAGEPITMPTAPNIGTNTLKSLIRDPFKTA